MNKVCNPDRYKKLKSTLTASPDQLLDDLRIRAGHYAREARDIANKNIRISKILTVASGLTSIVITAAVLLFQAGKLSSDTIVWITVLASSYVAFTSFIQHLSFDGMISARSLNISQQFFEIKEEIKVLQTSLLHETDKDTEILKSYRVLLARYSAKREKFIEYSISNKAYYGFRSGPGKIKKEMEFDNE